jgi:Asp-tRNA(Asn)/Glu-tRNA(Gln) amidotransferase B subunit
MQLKQKLKRQEKDLPKAHIPEGTMLIKKSTVMMRSKEKAEDYRLFLTRFTYNNFRKRIY